MLFYERIEKWEDPLFRKSSSLKDDEIEETAGDTNQLEDFKKLIIEENKRFAIQKFVFNTEYFTFMSNLLKKT